MDCHRPREAGVVRTRRESVAIAGSDYDEAMTLVVALRQMGYSVIVSESRAILRTAHDLARCEPAAMVVSLSGAENVVEIRELLSIDVATRFLFLMPSMPPSAALTRLMNAHGAAIVAREDPTLLVVSTLVALLADGDLGHESRRPS